MRFCESGFCRQTELRWTTIQARRQWKLQVRSRRLWTEWGQWFLYYVVPLRAFLEFELLVYLSKNRNVFSCCLRSSYVLFCAIKKVRVSMLFYCRDNNSPWEQGWGGATVFGILLEILLLDCSVGTSAFLSSFSMNLMVFLCMQKMKKKHWVRWAGGAKNWRSHCSGWVFFPYKWV